MGRELGVLLRGIRSSIRFIGVVEIRSRTSKKCSNA